MYGYKTDVSVAPTSLPIDLTAHKPESVSDFVIFQRNLYFHKGSLVKEDNGDCDAGVLSTKYPDSWIVLLDKGS